MFNRVDSGSGGKFLILFGHTLTVRAVQHGNILINRLSIKLSKFPPLPESTLFDMRGARARRKDQQRANVHCVNGDGSISLVLNTLCTHIQGGACGRETGYVCSGGLVGHVL